MFVVVAALDTANFERAFVVFHQLFFPGKDNWVFDYRTDQIILILPMEFFRNCAILIVALMLVCCAGLIAWDLREKRKKAMQGFRTALQAKGIRQTSSVS